MNKLFTVRIKQDNQVSVQYENHVTKKQINLEKEINNIDFIINKFVDSNQDLLEDVLEDVLEDKKEKKKHMEQFEIDN